MNREFNRYVSKGALETILDFLGRKQSPQTVTDVAKGCYAEACPFVEPDKDGRNWASYKDDAIHWAHRHLQALNHPINKDGGREVYTDGRVYSRLVVTR